jgi:hypothetical protein
MWKSFRFWIGIIVSLVCLYFAFQGIQFDKLLEALRGIEYVWLILASLLFAISYSGRVFRWRLLFSPLVLRLARLLVEGGEPSETQTLENAAIAGLVESWRRRPGPSLVRFVWKNAEAMLVLPEGGQPVRDVVFITPDNIETGLAAYGQILTWAEKTCTATRFSGENPTPGWADYSLHYAFTLLSERSLERYEQFTGRILVSAVGRDIAISAEREGWDISIRATVVDEQILCRTLEETASIYRGVLGTIRHHMTVVLGSTLVNTIFSEILEDIEPPYGELIQAQGLSPEDLPASGQRLE